MKHSEPGPYRIIECHADNGDPVYIPEEWFGALREWESLCDYPGCKTMAEAQEIIGKWVDKKKEHAIRFPPPRTVWEGDQA